MWQAAALSGYDRGLSISNDINKTWIEADIWSIPTKVMHLDLILKKFIFLIFKINSPFILRILKRRTYLHLINKQKIFVFVNFILF